jgi:hypothetical protein
LAGVDVIDETRPRVGHPREDVDMAKRMKRISSKRVRASLEVLIGELQDFRRSNPREFDAVVTKLKKTPTLFPTTFAWLQSLQLARRGLEEWCPNPQDNFRIDVPPPPPRRRRT